MAGNRVAIWIALALWAGAVGLSLLALTAEPTGDGFTRGLNRVTGFLGWQSAAALLALVLWLLSLRLPKGAGLRWLARGPGWWAMLLLLLVAAWIAVGYFGAYRVPPAEGPPALPTTTVPAD